MKLIKALMGLSVLIFLFNTSSAFVSNNPSPQEKIITQFPAQSSSAPIINQPIPLICQNKNLETEKYTIIIEILDKVSSLSAKKEMEFEIR